jgi:hypothetical protein
VETIYRNDENQIALGLNYTLNDKSLHEIEAYDILSYYRIHPRRNFKEFKMVIPNGSSSIEKRINKLKIYFKANNNVHLIAFDLGLV